MTPPTAYLAQRRTDLRSTKPWAPFSYHNIRLRELVRKLLTDAVSTDARVLDYGCADQPYRDEVRACARYVGADLTGNPAADITLNADGTIPGPTESFDVVLSSQVLEHVEDPALYLSESYRVLRAGGSLVLTTHGIMYYHPDPEDYWRWMAPALRKIVEAAGFDVVEMRGVMGLASASLQLLQDSVYWRVPVRLKPVFALIMQTLIRLADKWYTENVRLQSGLVIGLRAVKNSREPT